MNVNYMQKTLFCLKCDKIFLIFKQKFSRSQEGLFEIQTSQPQTWVGLKQKEQFLFVFFYL